MHTPHVPPLRLTARLRVATEEAHRNAEARIQLDRWLVSRRTYAELLRRYGSLWSAIDRLDVDPDSALRCSTRMVQAVRLDLRALEEDDGLPQPLDLTPLRISNESQLRGFAYVAIGSRMGSRAIAQSVRVALGNEVPLNLFDDQSSPHEWRRACAWIDAQDLTRESILDATSTALRTFRHISEHLAAPSSLAVDQR